MATREKCQMVLTKPAPPLELPRSKHPYRLQNLQKSLQKPEPLPALPVDEAHPPRPLRKIRLDPADRHDLAMQSQKTTQYKILELQILPIDRLGLS